MESNTLPVLIACNNGSVDMELPAPIRAVVVIATIAVSIDLDGTICIEKIINCFYDVERGVLVHIDGQRAVGFLLRGNSFNIVKSAVNHKPVYAEIGIGNRNILTHSLL